MCCLYQCSLVWGSTRVHVCACRIQGLTLGISLKRYFIYWGIYSKGALADCVSRASHLLRAGVTYWVCLWVLGTQAPVFTGHSKGFIHGPWVVSQQILLYVTSLGAFKIISDESSPYGTKSETTKRCLLQKLWLVRKCKWCGRPFLDPVPKVTQAFGLCQKCACLSLSGLPL